MISLGPIFLPLSWIVLLLLSLITVWVAERWSPARQRMKGTVSDWLPTVLLIVLLVYKFGPALFNLQQIFHNPAFLLYGSGSSASFALAILLAGIWLAWKVIRSADSWETADVLAVAALMTMVVYLALFKDYGTTTTAWWGWKGADYRYHPLNVYRLALLLPLLIWVMTKWSHLAPGRVCGPIALWTGVVYMLTSFAYYESGKLILGLTLVQWANVLLAIIGFVILVIRDWEERVREMKTKG